MGGPSSLLLAGEAAFTTALLLCSLLLYCNTLRGGYVWDDRAAIVANPDVSGQSDLSALLRHDFWGQDIRQADSHKSYRPVTTLSYRLNHWLHGLDASGYHLANALIYCAAVLAAYRLCCQWMCPSYWSSSAASDRKGLVRARAAALLFCFHPVHVEAVASLVGRADALCGLFAFAAASLYTAALRAAQHRAPAAGAVASRVGAAYSLALVAALCKEIGVTVVGIFAAMEVVFILRSSSSGGSSGGGAGVYLRAASALHRALAGKAGPPQPGHRRGPVARLLLCAVAAVAFAAARVQLNGPHRLYSWTILENHISLLPSLLQRTLSYQQAFFWYMVKLVFPRYLCFDYGFACLPVIESCADPRALLPVAAAAALLLLLHSALRSRSAPLLLGLALLLLPLLPALNLVFPVGTVLAERLLFIPSLGASVLAAELLFGGARALLFPPPEQGSAVRGRGEGVVARDAAAVVTLVLCALGAARIVTRNRDWNSERAIYSSALEVCPYSVKVWLHNPARCDANPTPQALSNYAYLSQSADPLGSLRSSALAAQLLPARSQAAAAAVINSALASMRGGQHVRAMATLSQLLRQQPSSPKVTGYLGIASYSFAFANPGSGRARTVALRESRLLLLRAVFELGFSSPSTLFTLGSACLELGLLGEAVQHLRRAAEAQRALSLRARTAPVQDDVSIASVYNQLGAALAGQGLADEARAAMEEGIAARGATEQADGSTLALLINLGNALREQGELLRAADVFERAALLARQQGRALGALLNNYALVARDAGDSERALLLWRQALEEVQGEGASEFASGVEGVIRGNIRSLLGHGLATEGGNDDR